MVTPTMSAQAIIFEEPKPKNRFNPIWLCPMQKEDVRRILAKMVAPQRGQIIGPPWVQGTQRMRCESQITALFDLLQNWFEALEDGSTGDRLPDPRFEFPPGRPVITEELVMAVITELDQKIGEEVFGLQGRKYKADANSGFDRLGPRQQMTLVQKLMALLLSPEELWAY